MQILGRTCFFFGDTIPCALAREHRGRIPLHSSPSLHSISSGSNHDPPSHAVIFVLDVADGCPSPVISPLCGFHDACIRIRHPSPRLSSEWTQRMSVKGYIGAPVPGISTVYTLASSIYTHLSGTTIRFSKSSALRPTALLVPILKRGQRIKERRDENRRRNKRKKNGERIETRSRDPEIFSISATDTHVDQRSRNLGHWAIPIVFIASFSAISPVYTNRLIP